MTALAGDTVASQEIQHFLAAVRGHLADLDPDELADITDGLAADLTELVGERGIEALGDPAAYALELRSAAGLDEAVRRRPRRPLGDAVSALLDESHARWDALVDRVPQARPVLEWARPLWWLARGVVAAALAGYVFGVLWLFVVPALPLSVLVGLGRLWPGGRRGVGARVVLLLLNAFAVVMVPFALAGQSPYGDDYWRGYDDAQSESRAAPVPEASTAPGVFANGRQVSNIYPYDASGKPLIGVQLFDQDGNPIAVSRLPECFYDGSWTAVSPDEQGCWDDETGAQRPGRVSYPWTNGAAQLDNVFPRPRRLQDAFDLDPLAFAGPDAPTVGEPPMAGVPPVSLPGIAPSVQQAEAPVVVETPAAADTPKQGKKKAGASALSSR